MRGDLERLDRVAHRFERIGREPKFEPVDVGAIVERIAGYFQARVPTLGQHDRRRVLVAPTSRASFTAIPSCSSGRSRC